MAAAPKKLTPEQYERRDYRRKCAYCGHWMRYSVTAKTPTKRRPQPFHYACFECHLLPFPEQPEPITLDSEIA